MSGILDALQNGILDWKQRLQPGSFRGVPFYVRDHDMPAGRRVAVHEFPLRDTPLVEDLGQLAIRYDLTAYVLADDYWPVRDQLRVAMTSFGPGTLVHPYLGTLTVQPLAFSMREDVEHGRMAVFRLQFVDTGTSQPGLATVSTASALLAQISDTISDLEYAYTIGMLIATRPGFLLNAVVAGLGQLATALLGLPVGIIPTVRALFQAITASPSDTTATPAAIAAAFSGAAAQLIAAPPGASANGSLMSPSQDITGGLSTLCEFTPSSALAPNTLTTNRQIQAANAQVMQDTVRGLAVCAVASIYANTVFSSQQQAAAARAQLLGWIGERSDAAAAALQDQLYLDWQALAAAASADMTARAQGLPLLSSYTFGGTMPSLALAVRLYPDDVTQYQANADALDVLNGVMHPAFMPPSGVWLQP